jgi:hemoglobin
MGRRPVGDAVTLYSQLGGESGLAALVDDFYSRVLADNLLGPWFAAVNPDSIRFHLRAYLAVALGGPEQYTGRSMRRVHGGLRITGEAFDAVLDRMTEALAAAGTEARITAQAVAVLATLKPVVVEIRGQSPHL